MTFFESSLPTPGAQWTGSSVMCHGREACPHFEPEAAPEEQNDLCKHHYHDGTSQCKTVLKGKQASKQGKKKQKNYCIRAKLGFFFLGCVYMCCFFISFITSCVQLKTGQSAGVSKLRPGRYEWLCVVVFFI